MNHPSPDDYHFTRVTNVCKVVTIISVATIFLSIIAVMIGLSGGIISGLIGIFVLIMFQVIRHNAVDDRAHGLPPKLPWE